MHLLQEAQDDLPRATRERLESLHASELERLERLLTDGPREEPRSVPLAEVVDPFVDSVRTRGQRVLWGGTHCRAWGRRDEIAEIVHVLLENAARHASGADVAVEVSSDDDRVQLRVADRGPGVPPELAETLFDRGTRSRQSPGDGIGLHLAQRLSREMGGDLRLEPPVPGVGAAFALTLPADRGRPRSDGSRDPRRPPADPGGGRVSRARNPSRVAIVEDHLLFAEALEVALSLQGHDVHRVPVTDASLSSGQLLAGLLRLRPRVVLLDLDLGPAGSGTRLVEPLTQSARWRWCEFSVEQAFPARPDGQCVNIRFFDLPDAAPDAVRAFDLRDRL